MALTANREVNRFVDQDLRSYAVKGGVHIYKGAFVNLDANGYAQPSSGNNQAVGLAYEEIDNSGGSDGDVTVRVYTRGDFEHALSGVVRTNVGDDVYVSADDTLTFSTIGNALVGVCLDMPAAGKIILRLEPHRKAS